MIIGDDEYEEELKHNSDSYIAVDEDWESLKADTIADQLRSDCINSKLFLHSERLYGGSSVPITETVQQTSLTTEKAVEQKKLPCKSEGSGVLVIELSDKTSSSLDNIKQALRLFVTTAVDVKKVKIGVIVYGHNTAQTVVDAGNYVSLQDFLDLINEITVIGGDSHGDRLAIKTAIQILQEKEKPAATEQAILIIHDAPLR